MTQAEAQMAEWAYTEVFRQFHEWSVEARKFLRKDEDVSQEQEEFFDVRESRARRPMTVFIHDLNMTLAGSLEFTPSDTGNGLELTINEDPSQQARDETAKEDDIWANPWMEELKSSSLTPVHTIAGDIRGNLSGTSISCPKFSWRLDRLLSRHNHFDIYSSTTLVTCPYILDFIDALLLLPPDVGKVEFDPLCCIWQIRVYNFHGIPDRVVKFRRRSMKRLSVPHKDSRHSPEIFRPIPQDGNTYVPYIVLETSRLAANALDPSEPGQEGTVSYVNQRDDPTAAKLTSEARKVKAQTKQRERRQRERERKRNDNAELNDRGVLASVESTARSHKPTALERNLQFLIGIYDTDFFAIYPASTTEPSLSPSATLRNAAKLDPTSKIFEDEKEVQVYLQHAKEELSYLQTVQLQLPKIREMATDRDNNAETEATKTNTFKVDYASSILPHVIDSLSWRKQRLEKRFETISRAFNEWIANDDVYLNPKDEIQMLDEAMESMIPGSPVWKKALSEKKIAASQVETYRRNDELYKKYKESL
ncbi:hypothetical protein GQ44DRAFT_720019, partial [Phaeosphaeriaceae sp. PMI808]